MITFYKTLNKVNPNLTNLVMTVVDGDAFGEKALLSGGELIWATQDGFFAAHLNDIRAITTGGSYTIGGQTVFCELLGQDKKIVICGGGHISIPLIKLSRMVGFHVTVLEDRAEFADRAREAGADRVICAPFTESLAQIEGDPDTYFAIVTRGHQFDKKCLAAIALKPHAYIGMLGSKTRVTILKQELINEGSPEAVINGIYSPIGLKIGSETPEEIAISIMAEIIQVKSRSGRNSTYPHDLIRAIVNFDGTTSSQRMVLATIISRKGSSPRDIGTKMLMREDGLTVGTIGGGYAEGQIIAACKRRLTNGISAPEIITVDMSGTDSSAAMICGGVIGVLLESI